MSNAIFPTLPGLAYNVTRNPVWSTQVRDSASGRQYTLSKRLYPLWHFKLPFEVLRAAGGWAEWQTLVGFINARRGRYDDFLYLDPRDNAVNAQSFGVGDGSTTAFQLVRALGGFVEPVYDFVSTPTIFKNAGDWRGNEQQYTTARTNRLTNSSCDSNAGWAIGPNAVRVANMPAPDGTNTATVYQGSASAPGNQYISHNEGVALVAGQTYTGSIWSKLVSGPAPTVGQILTLEDNLSPNHRQAVNFNGSGISTSWQRFSVTFQAQASVSATFYAGADFGQGTQVALWGAQLEPGNLSPYIPTTTAAVTKTDASLASGLVTFAAPPALGAALTWSGNFYFRCRFLQDEITFEQFMQDMYSAKSVEFRSFRP